MLITVVVLIPKDNFGHYRGIVLFEVTRKLIEWVLYERMSKIDVHDCFHGFRAKCDYGTGIMEVKLDQQLALIKQSPLYSIFVDLWKVRHNGQGEIH